MFGSYSGSFGIFRKLLITEIDMFRTGLYTKKPRSVLLHGILTLLFRLLRRHGLPGRNFHHTAQKRQLAQQRHNDCKQQRSSTQKQEIRPANHINPVDERPVCVDEVHDKHGKRRNPSADYKRAQAERRLL